MKPPPLKPSYSVTLLVNLIPVLEQALNFFLWVLIKWLVWYIDQDKMIIYN